MTEQDALHSARASLDRELRQVKDDLLRMGDHVDGAIERAVQALRDHDSVLAQEVVEADVDLNKLRFAVEEKCLKLIATQQPAARDLRAIVAAMNMVGDLERMGDHAVGIANAVLRMGEDPPMAMPPAMVQLADRVRTMLRQALRAYQDLDLDLARHVAGQDDEIDETYRALFQDLLTYMANAPEKTGAAIRLQFTSHNLERIGDRTTNLVERVIFMRSGEMRELNPEPGEADIH